MNRRGVLHFLGLAGRRRGPPVPAVANGRARLVLMPSHVQPRRIIINGHPTSIRLEPAFWGWLREIAAECGMTAKALIEGIFLAKSAKLSFEFGAETFTSPTTFTAKRRIPG